MKNLIILMLFLCPASGILAQSKSEKEIRSQMNEQLKAWNSGDLEGFMKTYWQNDSLMFIGKSGVTYGWNNTLNNYKRAYKDTAAMGTLSFDILEVKRLSVLYYFVVGKWHLTRSMGDLEGHFTLLFKNIGGRWLIVADHSS